MIDGGVCQGTFSPEDEILLHQEEGALDHCFLTAPTTASHVDFDSPPEAPVRLHGEVTGVRARLQGLRPP